MNDLKFKQEKTKINYSKLNKVFLRNFQNSASTILLEKLGYTLGKVIGEGTYSKVCVATAYIEDSEEKVACKIIHKKYAGSDFIKKFLPRELKLSFTINYLFYIIIKRLFKY